ncbi:MAG: hypothetical protein JWQ03_2590, partial [Variovorax sp.]|nr:hypothetical protein [Variovorax sp.]
QGVALAAVALAGLGAAWAVWRARSGTLHWDGQHWSFETNGQGMSTTDASSAAVALDFQSFLLLRLAQGRRVSWLWLDRRACPERWRDVRRAVHARAASDASLGAPPKGAAAGAAGPAR